MILISRCLYYSITLLLCTHRHPRFAVSAHLGARIHQVLGVYAPRRMDSSASRCLLTSVHGFTRFSNPWHIESSIHRLSSIPIVSTSYCNGEGRGFQPPPIILLTQLTKSLSDICWISLYCGAGSPSTPPAMRGAASRLFSALERAGFIPFAMRARRHSPPLQRRVAVVLYSEFPKSTPLQSPSPDRR